MGIGSLGFYDWFFLQLRDFVAGYIPPPAMAGAMPRILRMPF